MEKLSDFLVKKITFRKKSAAIDIPTKSLTQTPSPTTFLVHQHFYSPARPLFTIHYLLLPTTYYTIHPTTDLKYNFLLYLPIFAKNRAFSPPDDTQNLRKKRRIFSNEKNRYISSYCGNVHGNGFC